jgi:diacylglycerol O-acyltransferase
MQTSAAIPAEETMALEPEDLAILALECPTVVGHTCKIISLAPGGLDVDTIRARVAARLAAAPVLTRRLAGPPNAREWVQDPEFDLARHVVAAPAQGPLDPSGLRGLVGKLFAQHLDRERPLWRMDVAPLADGGTAVIWRLHHALADGTTMMRWARALLWDEPEESAAATRSSHAADEARRRHHLAAFVGREFARSHGRSPFDGTIGSEREIGVATLPLGALKNAAHRVADATLNDALLSVLAGAVRRYIQEHHGSLTDIRVRVPVSLHHEGDATANRDSFFSLGLPLHISDPVERLRVIHAATALRKGAHDAELEDELLHQLAKTQSMQRFVTRLNDSPRRFALCISNVPGPKAPVSVEGIAVNGLVGFAEIGHRHGLRAAAVSLHDSLSLGFCADPALVPQVQTMADFALLEATELVAAGAGEGA